MLLSLLLQNLGCVACLFPHPAAQGSDGEALAGNLKFALASSL